MVEIPEPGSGSVSLNLSTEPSAEVNTDTAAPIQALSIPILDEEDNVDVSDLNLSTAGVGALANQRGLQTWMIVLGAAIVLLIGVFVILSRQTTLFQGSIQQSLGDEEIITTPVETNFDNSEEIPRTPTENTVIPTSDDDELIVGPTIDGPVVDSGEANDADSIIDQLLGLNENQTDLTDEVPVINDPEFDDSDITFTPPVIVEPNPDFPIFTDTTPNQTVIPNPNNQTPVTPTLVSNTDPNVLSSAEVQGNTGPGVLIYFLPPMAAYFIRRKNVR